MEKICTNRKKNCSKLILRNLPQKANLPLNLKWIKREYTYDQEMTKEGNALTEVCALITFKCKHMSPISFRLYSALRGTLFFFVRTVRGRDFDFLLIFTTLYRTVGIVANRIINSCTYHSLWRWICLRHVVTERTLADTSTRRATHSRHRRPPTPHHYRRRPDDEFIFFLPRHHSVKTTRVTWWPTRSKPSSLRKEDDGRAPRPKPN